MRVDFNVPIKNGQITNNNRIVETIPTIKKTLDQNPKNLILMSHLGRPDGFANPKYSLKPVAEELSALLNTNVHFMNDCVGEDVRNEVAKLENGEVILLENLRFHLEEEGKGVDPSGNKVKASKAQIAQFRQELTSLADIYINDAFGTAHRDHSSMTGVNLPIRAAGLLLKKEIDYFAKALETPHKPYLVILGGAKINDKIQLIHNLLERVDEMIIGGGMAFTFLKVLHGIEIGNSLFDEEGAKQVPGIMQRAEELGVTIHLPQDFLIGDFKNPDSHVLLGDLNTGVMDGLWGLDIGPKTAAANDEIISRCNTIVWNGPQGYFENEKFRSGSQRLVESLMRRTKQGAITIVGGGDSVTMA